MKIKRHQLKDIRLPTVRETREVTNIWTDSEWSYIPELKVRRQFMVDVKSKDFQYLEEPWDGVIPNKVLNEQKITYVVYNHKKMWSESCNGFTEVYVIDEP